MHNDRVGVRDVKREKRGADSWDLPQHQLYSHLEMACPLTHYDFQLQTIELAYICNWSCENYLRLLIWRPSYSPSSLISPHKIMFSAQAYSFPKEQSNIQAPLYLLARKTSLGGERRFATSFCVLHLHKSLISSPLRWLPKSRAWCIGGFGSWTKACRKSSLKTSYPFRLCLRTQHREPAKRGLCGLKP